MISKITQTPKNISDSANKILSSFAKKQEDKAIDPMSNSPTTKGQTVNTTSSKSTKIPGFVLLKEWDSKAIAYSDLLPYAVKISDDVVLNKDASLTATFRYRGEDLASQNPRAHAEVAKHLNDAVENLGRGWMMHFHSMRRVTSGYLEGSNFSDPTSAVIDAVRKVQFENADTHYTNEQFVDLTYLPPPDVAMSGHNFFIDGREGSTGEIAAIEALKTFNEKLTGFHGYVQSDLRLERVGCKTIDTEFGPVVIDEQVQHFIECATGKNVPVRKSPPETDISQVVANVPIENSLRLQIGEQLCATVVVRDLPAQSYPGMFDFLNQLPYEYRISWRYIVRDPEKAKAEIEIERKKWFQKRRGLAAAIQDKEVRHENRHAVEMSDDAQNALTNLDRGEVAFGWFTMTLVFWQPITTEKMPMRTAGEAMADLMLQISTVTGYLNRQNCVTYFERVNVLEAFLGTQPAIGYAQVRRSMLSSRNLADFVPTHAVWQGKEFAPCPFYPPESPPLAKVSTTGRTPFNLNLHVDDVGHFMIAGSSGAGKSVLLGFLMVQHRRYARSRQIILDIDRSHYTLCNAVGGAHFDIGAESSIRFAPLAHIGEDDRELKWAITWILELLEAQKVSTKGREQEIGKALVLLARSPNPKSITSLTLSPYLNKEEKAALRFYTLEGEYKMLDGEEDFTENSDFICYEMAALSDYPKQFREPFLSYLFHRIERQCDGSPTMIVMEEVWTFLETPQAAEALIRWLRVMRKANVMVGFATQSIEDYLNSKMASTIINNCQTKIFLPNPEATTANQQPAYRMFGLTPWQISMISKARSKREYYVYSTEGKRMITLDLVPVELAFIGISNRENVKRVQKLVEAEKRAILEDPGSLAAREPWQAQWLRMTLKKPDGDEWANFWLQQWRHYGGWTTTINKVKNIKNYISS